MELNENNVFDLLRSDSQYPVDFDDAWRWLGFSTKRNAKVSLLRAGFIENEDFMINHEPTTTGIQANPSELIRLTIDCFKSWAMMAETTKGKAVRRYFIGCESRLKELLTQLEQNNKERVVRALVSKDHTRWQQRFEKEFFDEAYRVTGWQSTEKGHPSCMGRFIKNHIYQHFPEGTVEKLEEINPRTEKGRKRKHHQHLKSLGVETLGNHKMAVIAVMRLSPDNNQQRFQMNMQKALGSSIQLELPFLDDVS